MANFLFEIGAEELPAGQIVNISNYIRDEILKVLNDNNIKSLCYYSPRRLFWSFDNINLNIQDQEQEIKGPPESIAKSADGNLNQAAEGFIRKNNLNKEDVFFKDGYLYAKQIIKAKNPKQLLEENLCQIISSTPGVRFMRSADGDMKFARPLQWLMAILVESDSKLTSVDFQIEKIKSSNLSYGHRFLSPAAFEVTSLKQYKEELERKFVWVSFEDRKAKIISDSKALAQSIGADLILDEKLLEEVALITENPSPILCEFDEKFLVVPDCVLETVMIHHQRYLPLQKNGKLISKFIAVANNHLPEARANIKSGNEKVIIPRFKDAEFFVQEDTKLSQEERLIKLEKLNFLKGNMLQKSTRLAKLAEYFLLELKLPIDQDIIQAARLCKTDLSTNLVFEFTELQGQIGGIYLAKQGYSKIIVDAVSEHYKPRFSGDDEPETEAGKILSIIDKLDNIVIAFAMGKLPTGSADPFALRRQANGLLEIIVDNNLDLDLEKLLLKAIELQQADFGQGQMIKKIKGRGDERKEYEVPELNWQDCFNLVRDFLESRLEFVFEIFHKDIKVNKAVLALPNPLRELRLRHSTIHAFASLKNDFRFSKLTEAITRVINIAAKDQESSGVLNTINTQLIKEEPEMKFLTAIQSVDMPIEKLANHESTKLLELVEPINEFFDKILVNVDDQELRRNRKNLVKYASKVFAGICDFSLL
ncbi:MAG: glycine--tRNA ligase subunit beta [Candidatus Caenarcaniphilales bacterium]|jgi:glycyl-tRNA synthetase beta chain|nr:glycine--tRNA ligase subunit beta [Candidatus Caenarcaniphilales bacterium]